MAVVGRLVAAIADITRHLDEEVERGYDLTDWGDLMKLLHALQLQAQALMDLVQRAASELGYAPSTYVDAARRLVAEGLMSREQMEFFRRIVGFRNVVVHEYLSVDTSLVDRILRRREYRRVLELAEEIHSRLASRGIDP